ncbi:hypothetical protein [Shewanella youngdeokensis]|uniref:Uncharacterized protein n=1 Tax=Shewanella youngdeokensis TaxID=2999068 RepID=A0ABZ0JYX2_9GAMM|nr:hypothetical protein RGE70_15605 [Shewanella sp. DAU334]
MKIINVFAVVIAACSLGVAASEQDKKTESNDRIVCEYTDAELSNFQSKFTSLLELSSNVGPMLCEHVLRVTEDETAAFEAVLFDYAALAKEVTQTTYPETVFPGINRVTELWQQQLSQYSVKLDYVNPIRFTFEDAGRGKGDEQYILRAKLPPHGANNRTWYLGDEEEAECKKTAFDLSCRQAADNLNSAIKPAFALLNAQLLRDNGQLLAELQSDWKAYIKEARYQTPLDVWLTTALQSNHFHGTDLVGPPQWQAFMLRPSLVFEHIDELKDGDKDDVSLAVEWAGVNWWKTGIGFSLTSVYHDRKEVDALGHGLTIHIKNKYSIGYVHRSDNNGSIFFNIDLLEWLGDSEGVYQQYKGYF